MCKYSVQLGYDIHVHVCSWQRLQWNGRVKTMVITSGSCKKSCSKKMITKKDDTSTVWPFSVSISRAIFEGYCWVDKDHNRI